MACIAVKSRLRPGETVQGARGRRAARVDVPAALARRDFMVVGYSDVGQRLAGGPGYRPAARHRRVGRHQWRARNPAELQAILQPLPLEA
jgi:hypothetical protein